ncbi:MAG: hypothetical protein ACYDDF_02365 [Thermoplasmatota archaeon]
MVPEGDAAASSEEPAPPSPGPRAAAADAPAPPAAPPPPPSPPPAAPPPPAPSPPPVTPPAEPLGPDFDVSPESGPPEGGPTAASHSPAAPRAEPRSGTIPPETFYRALPPKRPDPLIRWAESPLRHGAVFFVVGLCGTLVLAASELTQVVAGAPIFEEIWKFGAALLLIGLLRVRFGPLRIVLAWIPGVAFAVMEHYLTYPGEDPASFILRLVFHSGSVALSTATYHVLEPVHDVRLRWVSTIPSTFLHWLNNYSAVILSLLSMGIGDWADNASLVVSLSVALMGHIFSWTFLVLGRRLRGAVLGVWSSHAPPDMRRPT